MTGKNIIIINGRKYDGLTGLPVADVSGEQHHAKPPAHRSFSDISKPVTAQPQHAELKAHAVHKQLQKSQTLNRSALKKPMPLRQLTPVPVKVEVDSIAAPTSVQHHRSPMIKKFSPEKMHQATTQLHTHTPEPVAAAPRQHPLVTHALAKHAPAALPQQQSSSNLKEALIQQRVEEAESNKTEVKHHRRLSNQPRLATILTSSLALLLLAGYLTYINLPNISMRVAATRAGIAANYPNYQPDGYHFAGPISYQPGEVNITFKSNTNNNNFVIKQKSSNWDSQAVLDNYVTKQTDNYLTYEEHGLTIYSFNNHAAWVNGGLLYTIDGDAPLSSDQLLHLATSM